MKCIRSRYLLLLIFTGALFSLKSTAGELHQKRLKFESLTINDGLSQGMINCILQDRYGFMWFATKDGLNRYDGYQFVIYKHDPSDSTTIIDNFIQTIFEDSKGRLWIGTATKGLELFNRGRETFTHFYAESEKQAFPGDDHVMAITEDKKGTLWICTLNSLVTLQIDDEKPASKKKYTFTHVSSGRFTVYVSAAGDRYLAGNGKLYFIGRHSSALTLQDSIPLAKIYASPDASKVPQQFFEDTISHSLYFIFNDRITRKKMADDHVAVLSELLYHKGYYICPPVSDLTGKIWFCELDWLLTFDTATRQMSRIIPFDPNFTRFLENINTVYRDRSGILWIGTKGYGILKHNPATEKFNRTDNNTIIYMSPTLDGKILVCRTGRYVDVFDPVTASYTGVIPSPEVFSIPESNPGGVTDAAIESEPGVFWICKSRIIRYDANKKKADEYRKGVMDNFPVYKTRNNEIWCGGIHAFCKFDKTRNEFVENPYPVYTNDVPYRFLQAVHEDEKGIFWLGTTSGLFRFDPIQKLWKQFKNVPGDAATISQDVIFSVCADPLEPSRFLWLGTNGGGLNRFEMPTGKVTRFSEKDGLPNDVVYGILTDDEGNLWMSTNKGISKFNPVKNIFRNFEMRDGLQSNEFNRNAYCKLTDGTLCFGGVSGFNYFKPANLLENRVIPQVNITDFKISNKSVSFKPESSPISIPSYLTNKITLQYKDNMVSFDFKSMDYTAPQKNLYQYKLEGFDQDWIHSGINHTATYTNLNPGDYTFRVRGSNSDEIWNNDGAKVELTILPPWYMTWWFRLLVLLTISAGIYFFYRYRLQQLRNLQAVRNRIARDLHDEIGSTLLSISLYSEVAGKVVSEKAPEAKSMLDQISESTTNMMEAMSDIVWTINTRNDRFDNIVNRMRAFAVEVLEARHAGVHFNTGNSTTPYQLGMDQRKNLYLIFKETINNAAKHSACKNVWVDFYVTAHMLHLKIKDDGKGFSHATKTQGNGLMNLQKRAQELGGRLSIESESGKGTTIELIFRI
jgi:ligand-binding sensor domain-containing protein/two-component sensor histidine kinase